MDSINRSATVYSGLAAVRCRAQAIDLKMHAMFFAIQIQSPGDLSCIQYYIIGFPVPADGIKGLVDFHSSLERETGISISRAEPIETLA